MRRFIQYVRRPATSAQLNAYASPVIVPSHQIYADSINNCARQQNICAIPLTRQYFTKTIGLLYVTHCMGKDE
jgi:hypothetical protein